MHKEKPKSENKSEHVNEEAGLVMTTSDNEIRAYRPEPIVSNVNVVPYKRRMDPQMAIDALVDGYYVLIGDYYSSGLIVLKELKDFIKNRHSDQSFQGQRDSRAVYRELSHRLLLLVSDNKLTVRKAPKIGWLKTLYPESGDFLLPFPQVQGLNSSWQWYERGISIPGLNIKIHPWFGTYFPTRFEHLKLFDNWLKQYAGEKKSAIDIGIGCGVLTFQMLKHGFEKVYGTDSNPNAIIGMNEMLKDNELRSKISTMHGDLFAKCNLKTELIVFNPPWLPASRNIEGIDEAIYYEDNLIKRFFVEAIEHLNTEGRLVILFSNLAQIANPGEPHPIKTELLEGGRFQKELFMQYTVRPASKNTRRNQHWRASEKVELWVLKIASEK
ncbi:MAG: methyltransferase [Bacteroidales bacterium]|nr:methyltransferase [Bacteroidales bacterium]